MQMQKPVRQTEEYLFLYTYRIEGNVYRHLDYFESLAEAQAYFDRLKQPYIEEISLTPCENGYEVKNDFYPPRKSQLYWLHDTHIAVRSRAVFQEVYSCNG